MDSIDYFLGVINADEMSEDEDEDEEEPEANWSLSILNTYHEFIWRWRSWFFLSIIILQINDNILIFFVLFLDDDVLHLQGMKIGI